MHVKGPPFRSSGGFFAGVVTDGPVPLMEEFLVMAPGSLKEIGQVNDLGRKVHRDVFPDGRVTTRGTV